jgi:RHS repeat-associated protein
MLAVKHLDPIMGIDTHIVQPPGPVPPVPIPHPYIGMVLDVMDYIPKIGATVYVNGLPRGKGGTAGQAIPSHIPMGGVFVKPPTNESELFLGSATVAADDDPLVYGMLPVLSCQDIGMPAMPHVKQHSSPKSLMLPVSVPIPIPAGPLVMVGGPPSFLATLKSLAMSMAMSGAFKGLKKLASKSKRLQHMIKRGSKAAHDLANKALDKLGLNKLGRTGDRIRNAIHEKICSLTGHPVDVATGKVLTKQTDFELPGPIPLRWERVWYSTSAWRGPLGHGWHHAFDSALLPVQDKVVCIRTSDGRELDFLAIAHGEEAFDRKEKVTLLRDGRGYGLRMADGLVHRFGEVGPPGEPHRLVAIEDTSGNRIRFTYDHAGRLTRISDSGGRELLVLSDVEGRIAAIYAPHPTKDGETFPIVQYVYDAAGDMVESRDAVGGAMRFEYRGHLLIRETNRNGLSFYFQYDSEGVRSKCLRTWGDGGIYDHKLSYKLGETVVEDSLGHKTTYFHKRGTVYKTIDALGVATLTERNEFSELVKEVDGLGQTTTYERDERGNVVKSVEPDGATTTVAYDARNRPIEALDAVGGKWTWRYDGEGRLVEREDSLERKFQYSWREGRLATFRDPVGKITSFEYDGARNLVGVRTPDHALSTWNFDRLGRCVQSVNPNGAVQRREYDALGRLVIVHEADGNTCHMTYDSEGNVLRVKDVHDDVLFTYQGLGRVRSRTQAGTVVFFEYDTEERLISIRNEAGLVYRLVLDPNGDVAEEIDFGGASRKYQRDRAGRVVRVERPAGRFSEYAYDAAGRVVSTRHFDQWAEWFAYRKDGELVEAGNGHITVKLERDLLGRVVKESQAAEWVTSTYDVLGKRIALASSKKADVTIRRNEMGDVSGVAAAHTYSGRPSSFQASFTRDGLGLELERQLPGGIRSQWERDRLGRPLRQSIRIGDRWKSDRELQWEPNSRLKAVIDIAGDTVRYEHDALGNLKGATYGNGEHLLRMPDRVGNLFRREDRTDRKYGPSGHLLESVGPGGTTRYEYDAEGNLIRKYAPTGEWNYAFDGTGMLIKVVRPDGSIVEFSYDALGRRVAKKYRNAITRWIWDGNVPLHEWIEPRQGGPNVDAAPPQTKVAEDVQLLQRRIELSAQPAQGPPPATTSSASETAHSDETNRDKVGAEFGSGLDPITWVFEPDTFIPLAKIVGGKSYGIVTDAIGTPMSMYDDGGRIAWSAEIDAYGDLRNVQGDRGICPFRWPGQYEDGETGLYYNRFRYYDPEAGQYTSQDPIGLLGGLRSYAYAHDPSTFSDPWGLELEGVNFAGSDALYPAGPGQENIVKIKMQGSRGRDFTEANKRAKLDGTPSGYTWHHVDDFNPRTGTCTMQLVTTEAHEATFPHRGSVSQFEKKFGVKYSNKGGAVDVAREKGWNKTKKRTGTCR